MIGKVLVAAAILLTACAEPKYVTQAGPAKPGQKGEAEKAELGAGGSVWLTWEKFPTSEDFGSFIFKTGRENSADKSPLPQDLEGEIAVVLWMPSMGHGSSPVTVTKLDTGTYRADRVFFTMPGDWEIRIQRIVNGAAVDQAVIALRF